MITSKLPVDPRNPLAAKQAPTSPLRTRAVPPPPDPNAGYNAYLHDAQQNAAPGANNSANILPALKYGVEQAFGGSHVEQDLTTPPVPTDGPLGYRAGAAARGIPAAIFNASGLGRELSTAISGATHLAGPLSDFVRGASGGSPTAPIAAAAPHAALPVPTHLAPTAAPAAAAPAPVSLGPDVMRYNNGGDTPAAVYYSHGADGSQVFTDNPDYAQRMSDGHPLTNANIPGQGITPLEGHNGLAAQLHSSMPGVPPGAEEFQYSANDPQAHEAYPASAVVGANGQPGGAPPAGAPAGMRRSAGGAPGAPAPNYGPAGSLTMPGGHVMNIPVSAAQKAALDTSRIAALAATTRAQVEQGRVNALKQQADTASYTQMQKAFEPFTDYSNPQQRQRATSMALGYVPPAATVSPQAFAQWINTAPGQYVSNVLNQIANAGAEQGIQPWNLPLPGSERERAPGAGLGDLQFYKNGMLSGIGYPDAEKGGTSGSTPDDSVWNQRIFGAGLTPQQSRVMQMFQLNANNKLGIHR